MPDTAHFLCIANRLRYHQCHHTVKCRCNAVWFITRLHTTLWSQWQKVNQILESQQPPYIPPSRASYGVSIVGILWKIDGVITAPHCILILQQRHAFKWSVNPSNLLWTRQTSYYADDEKFVHVISPQEKCELLLDQFICPLKFVRNKFWWINVAPCYFFYCIRVMSMGIVQNDIAIWKSFPCYWPLWGKPPVTSPKGPVMLPFDNSFVVKKLLNK